MEGKSEEVPSTEEVVQVSGDFSFKKLKELHLKVNKQFESGTVDIQDFTEVYFEWTKLFKHLGKALVVAFQGK